MHAAAVRITPEMGFSPKQVHVGGSQGPHRTQHMARTSSRTRILQKVGDIARVSRTHPRSVPDIKLERDASRCCKYVSSSQGR